MTEATSQTRVRLTGRVVEVRSNQPIELTDPQMVYVVQAGELLVFGVETDTGEACERRFIMSAEPGEAVFGIADTADLQLIGAGNVGTEVRLMPLQSLWREGRDEAASLLGTWVQKMRGGIARYEQSHASDGSTPHAQDAVDVDASDPSAFGAACLARMRAHLDAALAADEARLKASILREAQIESTAVESLAGVLNDHDEEAIAISANPMLEACRTVAAASGITIVDPERPLPPDPRNALRIIAKASQMRFRRVALQRRWWRLEAGAMLATLKSDGTPVALVPTRGHGYEIIDHARGERTEVDARVAEQLRPEAYAFYPSWPAVPLTRKHILALGLRGTRWDLVRIALFGLASALLALVTPIATAKLFNDIIPAAARHRLLVVVAALLLGAVAGAGFQMAQGVALIRLQTRLNASLGAALWDRILRLPVPFFRRYSIGDLAARTLAIDSIRQILAQSGFTLVLSAVFSLTSLGLLFVYDATLAMLSILALAISVGVAFLITRRQLQNLRALVALRGEVSSLVVQQVVGVSKLRVTAAERRAFSEWSRLFTRQQSLAYEGGKLRNLQATFNAAFLPFVTLVVFWMLSRRNLGEIDPGTFLAFFAALGQVLAAGRNITSTLGQMLQTVPLYERARPILDAVPEVNPDSQDPGPLTGRVEVNHVDFRYAPDGPLILKDVSVSVEPGQFVALVGPSGAGKSSLIRLLLGFDKPEAGSVLFDGKDLATLDIELVRRQIGVVLQAAQLMPGSILTNIIGETDLTRDDAWRAASQAGLDSDLRDMPMGIDTLITEGSSTLSGGQKQRLLIARALASNPRLLLFDEATSALDNVTQRIVTESLQQLRVTRIVIAHRLSTIAGADKIIVMESGRVTESGTYDELMAAGGAFADLAARQIA